MNGERFLEAINRLPFHNSLEALRSFARSSRYDAHEQALLQMLIVLNLNRHVASSVATAEASQSFAEALLSTFYRSVLPRCSYFEKLATQLRYHRFLSVYLTWVYGAYRKVRVETLLRYLEREQLVGCAEPERLPALLNDAEEKLVTNYKNSITDKMILKSSFQIVKERWKHRFYTRNLWISLMWASLASVAVLSVMLSTRGSLFQFFDAILGWFEFFRDYFK